jgi:hypothetical protein
VVNVFTVASPALTANCTLPAGPREGPSLVIGPGRVGETKTTPSIPLVPGGGVSATAVTEKSAMSVAAITEMQA